MMTRSRSRTWAQKREENVVRSHADDARSDADDSNCWVDRLESLQTKD